MTTSPDADAPADRGAIITQGLAVVATWSLRMLLVAGALLAVGYVVGWAWVVVLPVLLAILISTVLEPVSHWLHARGLPRALAAVVTVIAALGILAAMVVLIVRSVITQVESIANQASFGLSTIRGYLTGPPLNLDNSQLDDAVTTVTDRLQSSATTIANGVVSGVSTISSLLVTALLAVVLTFFFLKDGHRFPPFVEQIVGRRAGTHVREVLQRAWRVLGGYVRVQALVALVDATLIGVGIAILGVPLALTIGVITFLFSFVPIAGAVAAGALAVLLALVTNGFVTALLVLAVVLFVQQVEGNLLQPFLQGHSLQLHAGVVLLAVTGGASLFGIVGALLAVPVVGVVWEVGRYLGERIDARTGVGDVADTSDEEPGGPADPASAHGTPAGSDGASADGDGGAGPAGAAGAGRVRSGRSGAAPA